MVESSGTISIAWRSLEGFGFAERASAADAAAFAIALAGFSLLWANDKLRISSLTTLSPRGAALRVWCRDRTPRASCAQVSVDRLTRRRKQLGARRCAARDLEDLRWVSQRHAGDGGMVSVQLRLRPEEAALVINAIESLADHIEHWDQGGDTSLENLIELCRRHHRFVHEYGYAIRRENDAIWFVDPAGHEIPDSGERPYFVTRGVDRIGTALQPKSIELDPDTHRPDWEGSTPDYGRCIGSIFAAAAGAPALPGCWTRCARDRNDPENL